jgi:transcriptional regulator with XRE-family HTH domain
MTKEKLNSDLLQMIAKNMHRLMARSGLDRKTLAEKSEVSFATISLMLNATATSNPKPATIRKLAKGFGVDIDEFYK